MLFKNVVKAFGLLAVASIASAAPQAYTGECTNIVYYLKKKNVLNDKNIHLFECNVNENGRVKSVRAANQMIMLDQRNIDTILASETIEKLDVYANINEIPDSVYTHSNLKSIALNGGSITQIPDALLDMKNLRELVLYGNKITAIPENIDKLVNLQYLYLGSNQIKAIPKRLGNLKNLKYLYLDHNQISQVPKEMGNLKSLKLCYLGGNKITELPAELPSIRTLTELNIEGNPIKKISRN